MFLHRGSSLRRALALPNVINKTQNATLKQLIPEENKLEHNVVTSPFADCKLHDMTLVQRILETSTRWPQNIAMVNWQIILKVTEIKSLGVTGMWSVWTEIYLWNDVNSYLPFRKCIDSNGFQERRSVRYYFTQHSRIPYRALRSRERWNASQLSESYIYSR